MVPVRTPLLTEATMPPARHELVIVSRDVWTIHGVIAAGTRGTIVHVFPPGDLCEVALTHSSLVVTLPVGLLVAAI